MCMSTKKLTEQNENIPGSPQTHSPLCPNHPLTKRTLAFPRVA